MLRRSQPAAAPSQLELGDLSYSPARGVASVGGHDVSLTLSEGRILEALLAQAGEPIDKQALAQHALVASSRSTTVARTCMSATCAATGPARRRQPADRRPAQPWLSLFGLIAPG